jgi:hypothetical protein
MAQSKPVSEHDVRRWFRDLADVRGWPLTGCDEALRGADGLREIYGGDAAIVGAAVKVVVVLRVDGDLMAITQSISVGEQEPDMDDNGE